MKQIGKTLLLVLLIVMAILLAILVYGNYSQNRKNQEPASAEASTTPTPAQPEEKNEDEVSLVFCGDFVCHTGINEQALKADGSYDYSPIMACVKDVNEAADFSACTIETSLAGSGCSGYPMFKSPDALATSLKNTGFDLINTASNHCMDGLKAGLFRTLDVLDQNGLDHVGTYRSQEERDKNNGIVVKEINGIKIAIVSYTYGTNGIPVTGFEYAVNLFYKDYTTTLRDIDYDSLGKDMAAAKALNPDLTIVMCHWGAEYQLQPGDDQKNIANFLFEQGADIIIGGHTHCPEPMEMRVIQNDDGTNRAGFIVYSLSNFISCQNDDYTNLTAALNIKAEKNKKTGDTYLTSVSYKPLYMVDLQDFSISADWRYRLWDLNASIASYDKGDNLGVINSSLYADMTDGVSKLHSVFGAEFDEANGGIDVVKWLKDNQ